MVHALPRGVVALAGVAALKGRNMPSRRPPSRQDAQAHMGGPSARVSQRRPSHDPAAHEAVTAAAAFWREVDFDEG